MLETRLPSGDLRLDDCACAKKAAREAAMIDAAIPEKYRRWTMSRLTDDFKQHNEKSLGKVDDYLKKLKNNVNNGRGLWLCSAPGLAKSSIICYILRRALKKGLTPYFIKSSHAVNLKFEAMRNDKKARGILSHIENNVDILAFEEIEKVYMLEKTPLVTQHFYDFISEAYDSNISLLISSNVLREKFEKTLPTFIRDRLKNVTTIPLVGLSHREHEE